MSVSLSPSSQLGFQRPLTQLVKRTLAVSNSNSQPVAFKVKTTAPKQYCVRPNSGRIEPGETVEVQVLLQPMKEDPAPGTKCRDKFLVQSVIISTERETNSLPELWSAVEKEDKQQIHEQKIRCTYLPAVEEGAVHSASPTMNGGSTTSTRDESNFNTIRPSNGGTREALDTSTNSYANTNTSPTPPSDEPAAGEGSPAASYSVPSSVSATTEKVIAGSGAAVAGAAAAVGLKGVASAVEDRTATAKANVGADSTTTSSTTSSTPVFPSAPAKSSGGDSSLESQLASAKAEIARLQAQLSQAETTAATLRSRGTGAVSSGGAVPGTAQAVVEQKKGVDGIPIEVVAGLVFGTFVVTWLFF